MPSKFQREVQGTVEEMEAENLDWSNKLIEATLTGCECTKFLALIMKYNNMMLTVVKQMKILSDVHPYVYASVAPPLAIERYKELTLAFDDLVGITERLVEKQKQEIE